MQSLHSVWQPIVTAVVYNSGRADSLLTAVNLKSQYYRLIFWSITLLSRQQRANMERIKNGLTQVYRPIWPRPYRHLVCQLVLSIVMCMHGVYNHTCQHDPVDDIHALQREWRQPREEREVALCAITPPHISVWQTSLERNVHHHHQPCSRSIQSTLFQSLNSFIQLSTYHALNSKPKETTVTIQLLADEGHEANVTW